MNRIEFERVNRNRFDLDIEFDYILHNKIKQTPRINRFQLKFCSEIMRFVIKIVCNLFFSKMNSIRFLQHIGGKTKNGFKNLQLDNANCIK